MAAVVAMMGRLVVAVRLERILRILRIPQILWILRLSLPLLLMMMMMMKTMISQRKTHQTPWMDRHQVPSARRPVLR
jgi:hypothetical protein